MKDKNEIILDNNNSHFERGSNRHPSKKFKITTLPPDFYRKIIELENKIQLSQPTMEDIKELGSLYKKAIEAFCTTSPKKVRFFSDKLNKLLLGAEKISKKQNKKRSKWSQYMNSHRKNYNNFMLFLEFESSNQEGEQIMNNQNEKFEKIFIEYYNNIDLQKNSFKEKINLKRQNNNKNEIKSNENTNIIKINEEKENINNINIMPDSYNLFYNKFKGRNDLVDLALKDFIKKFHYIYLNSRIFKEPIESFNYILDNMFCHKVSKYFDYQEQIKEFQMMIEDKDQGNNEDSLAFLLTDLQESRKNYYHTLEDFIGEEMEKIKDRCAGTQISKSQNMEKHMEEFMKRISKIFY